MSTQGGERPGRDALLEAVLAIAADLSLETVLHRIVVAAAEMTGATYAAMGVLRPGGGLRAFITHGMDVEQRERVGALPQGLGLLGHIIEDPTTLRLQDLRRHPASSGFPAGHPEMTSFMGMAVRVRGTVFGNLYLTEKVDGDFTAADEDLVSALASVAGVVIDNAQHYEEGLRRQRWLGATAEITSMLCGDVPPDAALQRVVQLARSLSAASLACVVSGSPDWRIRALAGPSVPDPLPAVVGRGSLLELAARQGEAMLHDRAEPGDLGIDPDAVEGLGDLGPVLLVPFRSGERNEDGVLVLGWARADTDAVTDLDPALPMSFAEHAAVALRLAQGREDRRRLALYEDRERISRDLHDVVIQRLFALGLSMQNARSSGHPELMSSAVDRAIDELDEAVKEVRRAIFSLGAGARVLDVRSEVVRIVDRAQAALKLRPTLHFRGPVQTLVTEPVARDVLAVVAEGLANVARHAGARHVEVGVEVGRDVVVTVDDDGVGPGTGMVESGLRNLRERAASHGGHLEVASRRPAGTTLRWTVPVRL